jgi:hypothetical protein
MLPWHSQGHPVTGLNKRNAAIGRWVEVVEESRIIREVGTVPDKHLVVLAKILDRLFPRENNPPAQDIQFEGGENDEK